MIYYDNKVDQTISREDKVEELLIKKEVIKAKNKNKENKSSNQPTVMMGDSNFIMKNAN